MNSDSNRSDFAPKQARSHKSRQLILSAAREVIEDVGIAGLTLATVASRAGVAVGTVYNRFEDRADLIKQVVGEWTDQVSATFVHRSPETQIVMEPRASLDTLVRLFRENRDFIRQILIHAPLQPEISLRITPWLELEHARLVDDLSDDTAEGRDVADLVATMILATVERATLNQVDEAGWARLEADLPQVGELILNSMRTFPIS